MKIVTIGMSPYTLTSRGKMNSCILKDLYFSGESVASIVWAHDVSLYTPQEENGSQFFYYDFNVDDQKHRIPLVPFSRGPEEAVQLYDIIKSFDPDVILTIGDTTDFLFMKALKMFCDSKIKWVSVLMNYCSPINENNVEIFDDMDSILCTSKYCYNTVKDLYAKDNIDWAFFGPNHEVFNIDNREDLSVSHGTSNSFRLMTSGKSTQTDNIPMIMEAVSGVRGEIPNIELYVHSNIYDQGEYDLENARKRFDPDNEFIHFPETYVSLSDGFNEEEYAKQLKLADLFISAPMASASSITVLEAMACGSFPVLSDCGSNSDIADELSEHLKAIFTRNDFACPCIPIMTSGESYIHVCNPDELKNKIINLYRNMEKIQGCIKELHQLTMKYTQGVFLRKLKDMITAVKQTPDVICLETV